MIFLDDLLIHKFLSTCSYMYNVTFKKGNKKRYIRLFMAFNVNLSAKNFKSRYFQINKQYYDSDGHFVYS